MPPNAHHSNIFPPSPATRRHAKLPDEAKLECNGSSVPKHAREPSAGKQGRGKILISGSSALLLRLLESGEKLLAIGQVLARLPSIVRGLVAFPLDKIVMNTVVTVNVRVQNSLDLEFLSKSRSGFRFRLGIRGRLGGRGSGSTASAAWS